MKIRTMAAGVIVLGLIAAGMASRAVAQIPPTAAPSPPPSNVPAQTTATYGDWTLRCVRPADNATGPRSCEVLQSLSIRGQAQPIAQVALGSPAKGEPMKLTIVVPVAISFALQPKLKGGDPTLLDLTWRRCLPTGCFADGQPSADVIRQLRTRTEPMQITFRDAGNQDVTLPVSPRGLAQSLDALAKEDATR